MVCFFDLQQTRRIWLLLPSVIRYNLLVVAIAHRTVLQSVIDMTKIKGPSICSQLDLLRRAVQSNLLTPTP